MFHCFRFHQGLPVVIKTINVKSLHLILLAFYRPKPREPDYCITACILRFCILARSIGAIISIWLISTPKPRSQLFHQTSQESESFYCSFIESHRYSFGSQCRRLFGSGMGLLGTPKHRGIASWKAQHCGPLRKRSRPKHHDFWTLIVLLQQQQPWHKGLKRHSGGWLLSRREIQALITLETRFGIQRHINPVGDMWGAEAKPGIEVIKGYGGPIEISSIRNRQSGK